MKTSCDKPRTWKILLSALIYLWMLGGAALSGPIWHRSSLVEVQWVTLRVFLLLLVFAAPWFGSWGSARVPSSRSFLTVLRVSALGVFLAETLSVFAFSPLPKTALWLPLALAVLLAELLIAMFTLVSRAIR